MAVRSLRYVLTGEDRSASKALDKVGRKADGLNHKLAGIGGAAIGAGLIVFAKQSVDAFKEAQESQDRLEFSFSKFPKLADTNIGALRDLNTQLEKKTIYDDDALASGQAVLAQFNLTGKQLKEVTPLLADYASATGEDIPTAAQSLGRALLGNTRALKAVGINYKSTGNAGKDFENIQSLLNQKVGGFAEKQGKTAAGQAAILKNHYQDLQETVGSHLVPALNKAASALLNVVDFAGRNSAVIKPLVIVVGGFAAAVWGVNKAVAAWKATEKAFLVIKGLFTTAVVTEGAAATTTAGEVGVLAAAETTAGAAGTAGAVGLTAFAAGLGTVGAAFLALAGTGFLAYKFGDLAMHVGDGGGDVAHQPLDPHQPGGSANSGSSGTFWNRSGTLVPDPRFVPKASTPTMPSRNQTNKNKVEGRFRGGNIEAGRPYLVGERGPELITASRSGYVHTAAKTRALFNPHVRLDASQVVDNRTLTQLLTAPLDPRYRNRGAYAPAGMADYITNTTKISLDGTPIGRSVTRTQRRAVRNGAKPTFGL